MLAIVKEYASLAFATFALCYSIFVYVRVWRTRQRQNRLSNAWYKARLTPEARAELKSMGIYRD